MNVACALLLAAVLLSPALAHAQSVIGVVAEAETGAPIPDALVEARRTEGGDVASVSTDAAGRFVLRLAGPGRVVLQVSHADFRSSPGDTLVVRHEEVIQLRIRLGREVIPLAPLVVTARSSGRLAGFHQRQEQSGFGQFITRSDIERRPGARTTDLLREIPGIHIVRRARSGGIEDGLITMRGGQCQPLLYIDGVQVRQGPDAGLDRLLRPDVLEGVEVYSGGRGVPPQFAADGCGVIAFWTRSGDSSENQPWNWRRLAVGGVALAIMAAMVAVTR